MVRGFPWLRRSSGAAGVRPAPEVISAALALALLGNERNCAAFAAAQHFDRHRTSDLRPPSGCGSDRRRRRWSRPSRPGRMSPARSPPRAAGPPARRPRPARRSPAPVPARPARAAAAASGRRQSRPSPRRTRPWRRISPEHEPAVLAATAKQIPCAPAITAVLMPTTSPAEETSGAAGVAGIERRVGLDQVLDQPPRARAASGRARRPRRWSRSPRSPADCRSPPPAGRGAALERAARPAGTPARRPRAGPGPCPRSSPSTRAVRFRPSGVTTWAARALDHVAVGEDQAVGRDDEARAQPRWRPGRLAPAAHHRGRDGVDHVDHRARIGVEQCTVRASNGIGWLISEWFIEHDFTGKVTLEGGPARRCVHRTAARPSAIWSACGDATDGAGRFRR